MLANACDLRSLSSLTGDCAHIGLQFAPYRSRCQTHSIEASKSKKNFNASKRAPAKAKPAQVDQQAENKVPAPAPPRIDSNSNIPVRRQQRFVQLRKENEAAANKKVPYKQTFRKVKIDSEQRAEEAKREAEYEKAARAAAAKSPLASLQNLYGTSGREHPPIVLVDGYNVLYKFVETLQVNHSKHPVAAAQTFDDQRTALEHSMTVYSQTCGVKVVIVYDAINRPSDPVYLDIRTSSRSSRPGGLEVVFCSDQSADTWIVREVDLLQAEGKTPKILVATDDNEVVSSCNSRNNWPVPCCELIKEILNAEAYVEEECKGRILSSKTVRSRYGWYKGRQFENGTGKRSPFAGNQALQDLRDKQVSANRPTSQRVQSQAAS